MSSSPGLFFAGSGSQNDKSKSKPMKMPENPLLARNPAFPRTENAMVLKSSTNDAGLRQRRPLTDQQQVTNPPNKFNPPKSMLSLNTARTSIPVDQPRSHTQTLGRRPSEESPLPYNKECWVQVFGMITQEHFTLCKDHFGKLGTIIATRGSFVPGRQNWIAFQYESHLQATKAVAQHPLELTPGVICGVKPLNDNDVALLESNKEGLKEIWGDTGSVKRNLLTSEGGISENDLFLGKQTQVDSPKKRNCVERIICWILQIDD